MSDRSHRVTASRQDPGGTYKVDADGKVTHIADGAPGSRTLSIVEATEQPPRKSPAKKA